MRYSPLLPRLRKTGIVFAMLVTMGATYAVEQEVSVPMHHQVSLLERIWAYDRSYEARASDDFVVAVVYQELFRASLVTKTDFVRAVNDHEWQRSPGQVVEIEIESTPDLWETLVAQGVDVVYVTPLRAGRLATVIEATRRASILTCTGVGSYAVDGVAIGIELQSDGSAAILVNRTAARAEGADFSSELLKLTKLVGEAP